MATPYYNNYLNNKGELIGSTGPPRASNEQNVYSQNEAGNAQQYFNEQNVNLLTEAKNNSENPTLSFDVSEFDSSNEGQVIEMQKYLTSKGYDLGDLGENNAGGLDYWGNKSNQAYSQYAGTYEEPDVSSAPVNSEGGADESQDAEETIDDGTVIENINAIDEGEDNNNVVVSTSNQDNKNPAESAKNKIGSFLGQAWGAFKESGYKGMDEKVFNGHLPFGKKPYDIYQEKQQQTVDGSVDGSAENAIADSNDAVTEAGGKKNPKADALANFRWQSPQYGNYK